MLGEVIHGYRIDRVLSTEGGFGDVYLATHVESGAEAVVKVLKPEMSALRDIVARFFNEARAAASIHHPGIVQIHNVGYHADRAYLLMERLRGSDLETRLRAGPLPLDRALVFLRQTAGAIGAAHERGIVHRDLKPANLFVVEDPDVVGGERVKVLDFGIAKLTADTGAGKTQGVFGTPAYMSPEQCASTGAVDARADLYSLGCIFYELCCGRPPFGHGGIELIAAHLRDLPAPPRAIAPWIPPAIEQVILQLLEKQPDRRVPSCAALIAALDHAALSSGLAAGSMAHLSSAAPVSGPHVPPRSAPIASASPTTLGSAASAASTAPPRGRLGIWLAVGAMAVVVGAIAVVVALPGGRTPGPGSGSGSSGSGSAASGSAAGSAASGGSDGSAGSGIAVIGPPDAGDVAAAPPHDAAQRRVRDPETPPERPHERPAAGSASEAAIAAQLNEDGKKAMYAKDFERAALLFKEAAARVADAKYFLNLALAQFQLGKFDVAASAVRVALNASPSELVANKARQLLGTIAREAKRQGVTLHPPILASEMGTPTADAGSGAVPDSAIASDDEVTKLVEQARAELAGQHHDKALSLFQRAYEIEPRPLLLYNIGVAQYQSGRCEAARRSFKNLIGTWPADGFAAEAQKQLDRMKPCQ